MKLVPVSQPVLPPLRDLDPMLEDIWSRGIVTNGGPMLVEFERQLSTRFGWRNVKATSSGTSALQLACRALNLTDGELIVPAFGFPATYQALRWNRCSLVAVDIDPTRLTLDPEGVRAAITPRTVGIVGAHTFGRPADVQSLATIANEHGLKLLFDAAPAVGAEVDGISLPCYGDAAIVSFHATKVLTTIEGGAVVSADAAVADVVHRLRNFGLGDRRCVDELGTNAKLNEVQAAIGLLTLRRLSGEIQRRASLAARYAMNLAGDPVVRVLPAIEGWRSNHAYMGVRVRAGVQALAHKAQVVLRSAGFDSRRYFDNSYVIHGLSIGNMPNAARARDDVLCLPLFGSLPPFEIDRICEVLLRMSKDRSCG